MYFLNQIANVFRDGALKNEGINNRKEITNACEVAKNLVAIAGIFATAVTCTAVLSASPFWTITGGLTLAVLYDGYHVIDNTKQLYDNVATEVYSKTNKERLKTQLSKGTIFASFIINLTVENYYKS